MIEGENILVVAAHPDDEVLGVGGTIPLLKRKGCSITVLIVTDGSSTQYAGDTAILAEKREQLIEANDILGTDDLIEWQFPDMRLDTIAHAELNQAFEKLFTERKFDVVFVQNGDDINMDHQMIYKSVLVATRPLPAQSVKQVYSYQVNSSTEWGGRTQLTMFCPNVFIDIKETIETKLRSMEAYSAELRDYPHPRSIQAMRQRAQVYGNEVGLEYAEPFKLILARHAFS